MGTEIPGGWEGWGWGGVPKPDITLSRPEWFLILEGQRWEPFWCFIHYEGQSPRMVPTNYNFWKRRRAIVGSWTEIVHLQPDALPLSQTGPLPPTPLPLTIFLVTVTSPRAGLTRCNEVVFLWWKAGSKFPWSSIIWWLTWSRRGCLPASSRSSLWGRWGKSRRYFIACTVAVDQAVLYLDSLSG